MTLKKCIFLSWPFFIWTYLCGLKTKFPSFRDLPSNLLGRSVSLPTCRYTKCLDCPYALPFYRMRPCLGKNDRALRNLQFCTIHSYVRFTVIGAARRWPAFPATRRGSPAFTVLYDSQLCRWFSEICIGPLRNYVSGVSMTCLWPCCSRQVYLFLRKLHDGQLLPIISEKMHAVAVLKMLLTIECAGVLTGVCKTLAWWILLAVFFSVIFLLVS